MIIIFYFNSISVAVKYTSNKVPSIQLPNTGEVPYSHYFDNLGQRSTYIILERLHFKALPGHLHTSCSVNPSSLPIMYRSPSTE